MFWIWFLGLTIGVIFFISGWDTELLILLTVGVTFISRDGFGKVFFYGYIFFKLLLLICWGWVLLTVVGTLVYDYATWLPSFLKGLGGW